MARMTLGEQLNSMNEQLQAANTKFFDAQSAAATLRVRVEELEAKLAQAGVNAGRLIALELEVVELKKQLKTEEDMKKMYSNSSNKAESELEQAHAVLDSVAGAPAREYDAEYGKRQRNVVTRLAGAFLAIAQGGTKVAP